MAPVPLWATVVLGAMPLGAIRGTAEQQARWLPGVAAGEVRLSAALTEVAAPAHRDRPAVTRRAATAPAGGCTARPSPSPRPTWPTGSSFPPRRRRRAASSWPSSIPPVPGVDARAGHRPPTARSIPISTSTGPRSDAADVLAGPGDGAGGGDVDARPGPHRAVRHPAGVTEEAVRRAAAYLNQRHQFGRPLSSFQGTMLRAADAYIDTEAIRVTTLAGGLAHRRRPPGGRGRGRRPTGGRRRRASASCTPPSTSTAAWGPTSRTRSTATSSGASRSSSCSQGPSAQLARLGAAAGRRGYRRRRPDRERRR